jgi:hypothetical protein
MRRITMKRMLLPLALGLCFFASEARADDSGCGLTSAPLLAQPAGSVLIACVGGINDEFGNQLVDVLNKMLRDRLDPQVVLAKLEEIEGTPDDGVARSVSDSQRQAIVQSLAGKEAAQIAITAHPGVDDSAGYAKDIAAPLLMAGWQIEGHQIRRAAPKEIEPVTGTAIVVRDRDAPPQKAVRLKAALGAAHIVALFVADPSLAPDATVLWIGKQPALMQAEAAKQ